MPFTIGQVAKQTGLAIDTIRFYEREKLIPSPPRRASGYRQYSPDIVERILFIRGAKELGFTLAEIGELLELRSSPFGTAACVKQQAEAKIAGIENKIKKLKQIKGELENLVGACDGEGLASECPIVEGIASKAQSKFIQ